MLLKNNKKTQKSSHITLNFATDKTTSKGDNKEQLLDFNKTYQTSPGGENRKFLISSKKLIPLLILIKRGKIIFLCVLRNLI